MSGRDLLVPVKFAFLLVALSELQRCAMMRFFKDPVEIGNVIKAGIAGIG